MSRINSPASAWTALRALLGSPAFIRKDGATEMWRYDNANCHAFFFLYGAGAQRQVRHIETVPQGKGIAADPACLNALKKTLRKKSSTLPLWEGRTFD